MRSTLALALIILGLFAWLAAGNAAAQVPVPPTPTVAPAPTATPIPEKEQLEIEKLRAEKKKLEAETTYLSNSWERWWLTLLPALLAASPPSVLAFIAFLQWLKDRDKDRLARQADAQRREEERDKDRLARQADAQRREEEQFRFIVEQFSRDDAARLAAAVNIQTFFWEERFRRLAVETLISNLRVEQTETARNALTAALLEGIHALGPLGDYELDLSGCDLSDAKWWSTVAKGIPLQKTQLYGKKTRLSWADLREAKLDEAYIWDADLRHANLGRASLRGANLQSADLRDADLSGAHLEGANLQDAWLWGANLQGAVFGSWVVEGKERKTDFCLAKLDEACIVSLKDTNWREATWDDDIRQMLEERYGAPSEGATKPEAAAETPGEHEA